MTRAWAWWYGFWELAIAAAGFVVIVRLIREVSTLGMFCLSMLSFAFCAIAKLEAAHERHNQEKQDNAG